MMKYLLSAWKMRFGKKTGLLFLFLFVAVSFSFAQLTITGTVSASDTKETLPGATVVIKGTTTGSAKVTHVQNRRIYYAKNRLSIFNERNIYGKFAVAIDELLGAIKWVNQPIT